MEINYVIHTSNGLSYISKKMHSQDWQQGALFPPSSPLFFCERFLYWLRFWPSLQQILSVICRRKEGRGAARKHCEKVQFRCWISGKATVIYVKFPHPLDFFSLSPWTFWTVLHVAQVAVPPQRCSWGFPSAAQNRGTAFHILEIIFFCSNVVACHRTTLVTWAHFTLNGLTHRPVAKPLVPYLLFAQLFFPDVARDLESAFLELYTFLHVIPTACTTLNCNPVFQHNHSPSQFVSFGTVISILWTITQIFNEILLCLQKPI